MGVVWCPLPLKTRVGSYQTRLGRLAAEKHREQYWLYVVENVHSDGSVTEIQNPHEALASLNIRKTNMVDTYRLDRTEFKRRFRSKAGK